MRCLILNKISNFYSMNCCKCVLRANRREQSKYSRVISQSTKQWLLMTYPTLSSMRQELISFLFRVSLSLLGINSQLLVVRWQLSGVCLNFLVVH